MLVQVHVNSDDRYFGDHGSMALSRGHAAPYAPPAWRGECDYGAGDKAAPSPWPIETSTRYKPKKRAESPQPGRPGGRSSAQIQVLIYMTRSWEKRSFSVVLTPTRQPGLAVPSQQHRHHSLFRLTRRPAWRGQPYVDKILRGKCRGSCPATTQSCFSTISPAGRGTTFPLRA